jgi:hypothetical protein
VAHLYKERLKYNNNEWAFYTLLNEWHLYVDNSTIVFIWSWKQAKFIFCVRSLDIGHLQGVSWCYEAVSGVLGTFCPFICVLVIQVCPLCERSSSSSSSICPLFCLFHYLKTYQCLNIKQTLVSNPDSLSYRYITLSKLHNLS